MMNFDIKMPSNAEIICSAMLEIETQVTKKAQNAAALHGGVKVQINRTPNGDIQTIAFKGSQAAIDAAQAAVSNCLSS